MKTNHYHTKGKHLGKYLGLLLSLCFCLSACSDDMDVSVPSETKSVTIRVQLPKPVTQNVSTRAGVMSFNTLKDINVLIADGDNIIERGYYHFQEGEGTNPNPSNRANPEIKRENNVVTIHFNKDLTVQDNLTQKQFYIVANYGAKISSGTVKTVAALKQLKQGSSTPGIPAGCLMFAQAINNGKVHTHPDGTVGTSLDAELKRTVAMVTVQVDGSQLNKNISLSNFSISLHNVPTDCWVGQDNVNLTSNQVAANGEYKEYQQLAWSPIVGLASKESCGRKTWKSYGTTTGGHYNQPDNTEDRTKDPLFLFENLHKTTDGKPFGAAVEDQRYKRPASVTSTKKEDIEKGSKTCSYVKVRAHYEKIDDTGASVLSGWVTFKLFLGADVLQDFDVKRNHYYKVTLSLKGNAVMEGGQLDQNGDLLTNPTDATWRVDTDLAKASFGQTEFNFNASGEYFYIDVVTADKCWIKGDGTLFVWVYGSPNNDGSGSNWYSASEGIWVTPESKNGKGRVLAYAQPCYWDLWGDDISRKCTVSLYATDKDKNAVGTLTITQWKWITLKISSTDYPYIKETFGKDDLELHIDRIDREARPWGFYGVDLQVNNANGFNNTYYLFERSPKEHPDISHRKYARRYLPFGTETRPDRSEDEYGNPLPYNPQETVIDDGGSAMIYAAMLYENQVNSSPTSSPEKILGRDFPEIEKNQGSGYQWYWAIPSLEAWQLIEKEAKKGHLDSNHPIVEWFQYWSSDAVTAKSPDGPGSVSGDQNAGKTHSYAYQFGRGLDTMTEGDIYPRDLRFVRSDRLRFRLVSMQPDY